MPSSDARYDIVIFGASGFAGQYVVEDVIQATEGTHVTWAVAGRNTAKLEQAVKTAFEMTGKEGKEIPVIIADVSDEESLNQMCQKAKIVVNCVGPYRFYGEPVVKACIKNKAHHVDISGEPWYLERMQHLYNEEAKNAGVYIVGATGFDSVPYETALQILREKFPGDISYAESYVSMKAGPSGTKVNHGTWDSAVNGIGHAKDLKALRTEAFPEKIPRGNYHLPSRRLLFYSDVAKGWCLPYVLSDRSVALRTQYYLYTEKKTRPYYLGTYHRMSSLLVALFSMFMGVVFYSLSLFEGGRKLLMNHPGCFSFGVFSKEGPTRQQVKEASAMVTVVATGHRDKLPEPTDQHTLPPDTQLTIQVKGPEPGYLWTSTCIVESGLTILQELDKLPKSGGVFTPGVAFLDTTFIERLKKRGVQYVLGEPVKLSS